MILYSIRRNAEHSEPERAGESASRLEQTWCRSCLGSHAGRNQVHLHASPSSRRPGCPLQSRSEGCHASLCHACAAQFHYASSGLGLINARAPDLALSVAFVSIAEIGANLGANIRKWTEEKCTALACVMTGVHAARPVATRIPLLGVEGRVRQSLSIRLHSWTWSTVLYPFLVSSFAYPLTFFSRCLSSAGISRVLGSCALQVTLAREAIYGFSTRFVIVAWESVECRVHLQTIIRFRFFLHPKDLIVSS